MKQFGWLYTVSTKIPEWIVALVHPLSTDLFKLRRGMRPFFFSCLAFADIVQISPIKSLLSNKPR
jgi:hypothetical protein